MTRVQSTPPGGETCRAAHAGARVPEQLGRPATPRPPAERRGDRVVTRESDVTAQYRRGAEETLKLCQLLDCEAAVLKERSPSCGHGQVYDGTFSGHP